ncbi:MAG: TetR family transcriptional regulator [Rhodobacterales bacterium]|nr:MAG: TetR family transcriptional regulator [Rhodobacterales bacterium]
MTKPPKQTRIQKKNRETILNAALDVFSQFGFRGSTLDQIAKAANLSKPNLLYYFPSKEAIHVELLSRHMSIWLDPLRDLNPDGEPRAEILAYVKRKLEMSRVSPRESRLFANEVLQGAPRIMDVIKGELKQLTDKKAALIAGWMQQGKIARVDPYHLLFSIWSLTQHYADFEVQVRTILPNKSDPFPEAEHYLNILFDKLLKV